jgi:predicted ATPase
VQKIVVEKFGAIKSADIDIKKIVVLIGEQASGKSTIAKLVYFFKVLSDRVFDRYYTSDSPNFLMDEHLIFPTRDEFYNLFGSTRHLPDFEITYYYDFEIDKYIRLSLSQEKKLIVTCSDHFNNRDIKHNLKVTKSNIIRIEQQLNTKSSGREQIALTEDKLLQIQDLSNYINTIFNNDITTNKYIVAGRESTISYQTTFESYLERSLIDISETNRKKTDIDRAQTVDEILMLDFLKDVQRIRSIFNKYGGSFEGVINGYSERNGNTLIPSNTYRLILKKVTSILKGTYEIDDKGEKIRYSPEGFVYLKDASSGQKESIRILQQIVLGIVEHQKFFRVIEEPEAHLFPMAQKALVELLILMTNYLPESQLIITTHSPYVLTVINNLLFAKRVVNANPPAMSQVEMIINKEFFIDPSLFAAYSLGHSFLSDGNSCESIFDEQAGVIRQNFLDIISEVLGADFNNLYTIHANTYSKQA